MVLAVYGRNISEEFFPYLERMVAKLKERRASVIGENIFVEWLEEHYHCGEWFDEVFDKQTFRGIRPDIFLSIGGDGTFLDSVLYVQDTRVPILGVNTGRLGFLASLSVEEIDKAVDNLCDRCYMVEQRDLLHLNLKGKMFPGFDYGLNEVSIHKTEMSSLLKIHTYIGDTYLTTYWADGLIVSTPTGSTAYSLSGGGPIVNPDCKSIILTPVCPHNLNMRTLIVPNRVHIRLKVEGRSGEYMLSLDSRTEKMKDQYEIEISTGDFKVCVLHLPGHNYYKTLRDKLGWGEDKRNTPSEGK